MSEKKLVSIVVPCYNEEATLQALYEALNSIMVSLTEFTFEYIFVNDGSKDKTLSVLKQLAQEDKNVKYISFSRNFGKESALFAGLTYAKGDFVVTMDADMQDPPALLPTLLAYVVSGEYDNAATRRVDRKGEPPIRSFFARMFYKMMRHMTDIEIVDGARDYRAMNRAMVDAILSLQEYNRFSKGIFAWVGFETKWVEFENVERIAGETKWNFWKLLRYSVEGIVSFSNTPINMASYLGMFLTVVSAIALILPGISFSHFLLILGLYEPLIGALYSINLIFLLPLASGVFFGIVLFSKLLGTLMEKYPETVYLLILGFIIGSVAMIFPGIPLWRDLIFMH